jgi:hypothetical protein
MQGYSLLLLLHVSAYNFAFIREFTHQTAKFYILWVLLGVQNYNFPFLYGCETWSLIFKEVRTLGGVWK